MEGAEVALNECVSSALDADPACTLVDDQLSEGGAANGGGAGERESAGDLVRGLLEPQGIEGSAGARHGDPHDKADEGAREDEFNKSETATHGRAPHRVPTGCVDSSPRTSSPSREWKPFMSRSRLRNLLLLVGPLALMAAGACYQDPNKQLDQMQATIDLTATIEELGSRTTELQFTLDSLRAVVAKQDTVLSRLANLAGVPYSR